MNIAGTVSPVRLLLGDVSGRGRGPGPLRPVLGNDGEPFPATLAGNLSRSYENLTQADKGIGDARVWAGIHTRTADDHGGIVGDSGRRQVMQNARAQSARRAPT